MISFVTASSSSSSPSLPSPSSLPSCCLKNKHSLGRRRRRRRGVKSPQNNLRLLVMMAMAMTIAMMPLLFLPFVLAVPTTESGTTAAADSSSHSDVEPKKISIEAMGDSNSTAGTNQEEDAEASTTNTTAAVSPEQQSTALDSLVADVVEEEDLRSWLDMFGQVAKEYWTQHVIPPTNVECRWDWRVVRCEPYCHCHYDFQWGDYHVGRSCRQRPVSKFKCRHDDTPLTWEDLEFLHNQESALEEDVPNPLDNNNKAKQVLIQTVKVLQSTRDYLQQWTQQLQEKTHHRYEQLQDKTCGDLLSTIHSQINNTGGEEQEENDNECIPTPSKLNWKEQLLCRDLLLLEIEPMVFCESPTTSNDNWWQRLQNKFRNNHDDDDDNTPPPTFAESTFPELFPGWSAGVASSDWTAGAAAPHKHKHKNNNNNSSKRRPMISRRRNNPPLQHDNKMEEETTSSSSGGFARMSGLDQQSSSLSQKDNDDDIDATNNNKNDSTDDIAGPTTTTTSTSTTDTAEKPTQETR